MLITKTVPILCHKLFYINFMREYNTNILIMEFIYNRKICRKSGPATIKRDTFHCEILERRFIHNNTVKTEYK